VAFHDQAAAVNDEIGAFLDTDVDMSFDVSVPLPTFMSRRRSCNLPTTSSAVSSPMQTATEIAMQRSPQEP